MPLPYIRQGGLTTSTAASTITNTTCSSSTSPWWYRNPIVTTAGGVWCATSTTGGDLWYIRPTISTGDLWPSPAYGIPLEDVAWRPLRPARPAVHRARSAPEDLRMRQEEARRAQVREAAAVRGIRNDQEMDRLRAAQ